MDNLIKTLKGIDVGLFGSRRGWESSEDLIDKSLNEAKELALAIWSEIDGAVILTPAGRAVLDRVKNENHKS